MLYCILLYNIILYHGYSRKTSTSGGRPATLHASEPPDRLLQSFALEAASHLRWVQIPSGKRLHSYGKSPCLMGKSTISMGHVQ